MFIRKWAVRSGSPRPGDVEVGGGSEPVVYTFRANGSPVVANTIELPADLAIVEDAVLSVIGGIVYGGGILQVIEPTGNQEILLPDPVLGANNQRRLLDAGPTPARLSMWNMADYYAMSFGTLSGDPFADNTYLFLGGIVYPVVAPVT